MKKSILILSTYLLFSVGFSAEIKSGSTVKVKVTKPSTPVPMNAMPSPALKDAREGKIQEIDQPKQQDQLTGSNSSTWTPAYLKVKKFKKCLSIQNYRGWEGYCLPKEQPENCPDESWDELSEMNLIPCSSSSK